MKLALKILVIAAELLFIALVVLDLVLTYRVIRSGKGREAAFARYYINNPVLTYGITIAGVGLIFILIELSGAFIFYVPIYAAFAWACWNSWRVLK